MVDCLLLIDHGLEGLNPLDALIYKQLHLFHKFWKNINPLEFNKRSSQEFFGPRIDSGFSLTGVVLCTGLNKNGHSYIVFEGPDLIETHAEQIIGVLQENVYCVAISTTHQVNILRTLAVLEFVRKYAPRIKILVGGQGLISERAHNSNLFKTLHQADILLFGDGEIAFPEIVSRIKAGHDLNGIRGVWYKERYQKCDETSIVDLNAVSLPDYSLPRLSSYNPHFTSEIRTGSWTVSMEEGRGCRFKCRFCSFPGNNTFRRKKPERILEELRFAKAAGAKSVYLCGSNALSSTKDIKRLCKMIYDAKLNLNLSSYARLDLLSNQLDVVEYIKLAGWKWLLCGIESGDRKILAAMGKKANIESIPNFTEYLQKKIGIQIFASFIIGYPGECAQSLQNTKQLLKSANFHTVLLQGLYIFKDTVLYEMRKQYGLTMLNHYGAWKHLTMDSYSIPAIMEDFILFISSETDSNIGGLLSIAKEYVREYDSTTVTRLSIYLQQIVAAGLLQEPMRNAIWTKLLRFISEDAEIIPSVRIKKLVSRINSTPTTWWESVS